MRADADARIAEAVKEAAEANKIAAGAGEGTAKALAEVAAAKEREAEAREREAVLTLRMEEQREETAKALESAAKADALAANATRQLLEVQEQIGPRRLSLHDATTRGMLTTLSGFEGQEANFFVYAGDPETLRFAQQLQALLEGPGGAGWNLNSLLGTETARTVAGILVEVRSDADHESDMAALALSGSLIARGFDAKRETSDRAFTGTGTGTHNQNAKITITVGRKPPHRMW